MEDNVDVRNKVFCPENNVKLDNKVYCNRTNVLNQFSSAELEKNGKSDS